MKIFHFLAAVLATVSLGSCLVILLISSTQKPIYTAKLTFDSDKNMARQKFSLPVLQPGKYTLQFENANKRNSGYWVLWDYIALTNGNYSVWEIGKDDGSSAEFCDPQRDECVSIFTADSTQVSSLSRTLNDGRFPSATVDFSIANQQIDAPTILLSTIDSGHMYQDQKIDHFDMKVALWKGMQVRLVLANILSTFWGKMIVTLWALVGGISALALFIIALPLRQ